MKCSKSFEKLGTTAYGYVTVVDADQVRQTDHVIGDFSVEVYDPSETEISGTLSITMDEFEISGNGTGAYRFSVPIPVDSDEGPYTLIVTDPESRVHSCIFMAYSIRQGDTGDYSAQLSINIRNTDGSIPSVLILGVKGMRVIGLQT